MQGGVILMSEGFKILLSQIKVGDKVLRNRIVKTAAGSRYWSKDGFVTRQGKGAVR